MSAVEIGLQTDRRVAEALCPVGFKVGRGQAVFAYSALDGWVTLSLDELVKQGRIASWTVERGWRDDASGEWRDTYRVALLKCTEPDAVMLFQRTGASLGLAACAAVLVLAEWEAKRRE